MTKRTLAVLAAVVLALAGLAGCSSARDSNGNITAPTTLKWNEVKAGDCVSSIPTADSIDKLPVVPCKTPHKAQLFCAAELPAGSYPTQDQVQLTVLTSCLPTFKTFFGGSYFAASDYELTWIYPDQTAWAKGSHTVRAMVDRRDSADLTSDLKGTMTALADVVSVPGAGQCTGDPSSKKWNDGGVEIIDCAKPHYYEVYGTQPVTAKPASDAEIKAAMTTFCKDQYATFMGIDYDKGTMSIFALYPHVDTWDNTPNRSIVCMVGTDTGDLTGSLKDSKK